MNNTVKTMEVIAIPFYSRNKQEKPLPGIQNPKKKTFDFVLT